MIILGSLWIWGLYYPYQIIAKVLAKGRTEQEVENKVKSELICLLACIAYIIILCFNIYDKCLDIMDYLSVFWYMLFLVNVGIAFHEVTHYESERRLMGGISCILLFLITMVYIYYFENENKLFNFMVGMVKLSPIDLRSCNIILREYTMYLKEQEKLNEEQMTSALYSLAKFKNWFKKNINSLENSENINARFLYYMNIGLGDNKMLK